jgi:hypothetical protein
VGMQCVALPSQFETRPATCMWFACTPGQCNRTGTLHVVFFPMPKLRIESGLATPREAVKETLHFCKEAIGMRLPAKEGCTPPPSPQPYSSCRRTFLGGMGNRADPVPHINTHHHQQQHQHDAKPCERHAKKGVPSHTHNAPL